LGFECVGAGFTIILFFTDPDATRARPESARDLILPLAQGEKGQVARSMLLILLNGLVDFTKPFSKI
jgi:hypothetical protein